MSINGKFLPCEGPQGLMDIYVASPLTTEKAPVVIVLQEAFGVNHHIRSICNSFAAEGFLAASPELYHREGRRVEVDYTNQKIMMDLLGNLTNHNIIQDIRATINFLEHISFADTQNISTIGFCVGGFASALCATKLKIEKMISFYGAGIVEAREGLKLNPILNDISQIKSRCLFFFGGNDNSIPTDEITQIQKTLKSGKVKSEVIVFPECGHGFFCDERKNFDQEAKDIAWAKTLNFLRDT